MDVDLSMASETDHDQNHNNGPTQSPAPAEKEGSFLGRFVEAIHYYSSVFDSFGARYGEKSEERHVVEQQLLSKEIQNVLGIGGSMKFHNWREKLQQCGFKGISLAGMSMSVLYLRKHYLCFK